MTTITDTARPPGPAAARAPRQRVIAPGMDPVDAEIEQATRALQLPTIRDGYEEAVEHALLHPAVDLPGRYILCSPRLFHWAAL